MFNLLLFKFMLDVFDETNEMSLDYDIYSEADIGITVVVIGALAIVVAPTLIACSPQE
jgi:hypothetical protein